MPINYTTSPGGSSLSVPGAAGMPAGGAMGGLPASFAGWLRNLDERTQDEARRRARLEAEARAAAADRERYDRYRDQEQADFQRAQVGQQLEAGKLSLEDQRNMIDAKKNMAPSHFNSPAIGSGVPRGGFMDPTQMNAYQREAYLPQGGGFQNPGAVFGEGATGGPPMAQQAPAGGGDGSSIDDAATRYAKQNPYSSGMLGQPWESEEDYRTRKAAEAAQGNSPGAAQGNSPGGMPDFGDVRGGASRGPGSAAPRNMFTARPGQFSATGATYVRG
jgi:hypothetical protein